MNNIHKIKGFTDLYPPESVKYSRMEQVAKTLFNRFGYAEMRIPVVEKTELFARSIGGETDIVQKEMYTFEDKGARSVTLRPEATAGVVRAAIENKLCAQGALCKVFTFGPMFRYERPQKGRQRQFHQINVEVLGTASPLCDAEVVLMLWEYLSTLKLPTLSLEINSLGCPACRPDFTSSLKDFISKLDINELCEDCQRRKDTNPLRVLDCKVPACKELTANAPSIADSLCAECDAHFSQVVAILQQAGVSYVLNPRLVRGLDYYQRTTFEVVSGDIGSQSSVAGGGRYDGLVKQIGGPDIPGIGFACGMERIAMLMQEPDDGRLDFYMAVLDDSALTQGLILAQNLRKIGYSGEISYESKSLKSQMRQANKRNAKNCLLLGPDELEKQQIIVKDLDSGFQKTINQDDLQQALGLIPNGSVK